MNNQISELLTRGVEEVIDKEHLEARLRGKDKLRIKLGIDPTSPNIHIGRAVLLLKLRAFQDAGHTAIFIVGDSTGLVGDTSDKESERPMLTEKIIQTNMKTYFEQAYKILDKKKIEVYHNSEWLNKLGFFELAKMANLFGLHEMETREVIARRLKAGKIVSIHEAMYPLLQGYDSVAVKADLELGGTDQRFNLLAGRRIQKFYGQEPQDILMMPLMEGTDGRKMSSSWGNVINITDEPEEMFGKVMSVDDSLIKKYFILATRLPLAEVDDVISSNKNPKDQKVVLALAITALYHGNKLAEEAKAGFTAQFSKKELPKNIPVVELNIQTGKLAQILKLSGAIESITMGRILIEQGGIDVDGQTVKENIDIELGPEPKLFKVGKRKFVRIKRK